MSHAGHDADEPHETARGASGRLRPAWVSVGWIILGGWHVAAPANEASGWLGLFQIGVGVVALAVSRRRARRLAAIEEERIPLEEATRFPYDRDGVRPRTDGPTSARTEDDGLPPLARW